METIKRTLLDHQEALKKGLIKFHEYALSENEDIAKSAKAKIIGFEKELKIVRKDLAGIN